MSGTGNYYNVGARAVKPQRASRGSGAMRAFNEMGDQAPRQVPGAVYVEEDFPALTRSNGSSVRGKSNINANAGGKPDATMTPEQSDSTGGATSASPEKERRRADAPSTDATSVSTGNSQEASTSGHARLRSTFSQSAPHMNAFYAPGSYMTMMSDMTAGMGSHHESAALPYGVRMGEQFSQTMNAMPLLNGMGPGAHRTRQMRNGPRSGMNAVAHHVGEELATCTLQIELKRFYFDLRANERGAFLKIAEAEAKGSRSKIIIPAYGLGQFKTILDNMVAESRKEYQSEQRAEAPSTPATAAPESSEPPALPSSDAPSEADGDGQRGSEGSSDEVDGQTSTPQKEREAVLAALGAEAVASGTPQSAVIEGQLVEIPATGLPTTLASATMRVETKKYYFDLLSNAKGKYLKISQSAGSNKRSSIVVPATGLAAFRDSVHEMCRYAEMTLHLAANPNIMAFAPGAAPAIAYPMFPPGAGPPGMPSALYTSMGPPPPPPAAPGTAGAAPSVPAAPVATSVPAASLAEAAASAPTPPAELAPGAPHPSTAAATATPTSGLAPVDMNLALGNTSASLVHGPVQIPVDETSSVKVELVANQVGDTQQSTGTRAPTHLEITDPKNQRIRVPLGSLAALHSVLGEWLQVAAAHPL